MTNATVTVLEADGSTQTDVVVLDVGQQAAAASKSVVMASDRQNSISYAVTLSTDTAAYTSGDLIADTQQLDAFFNKTDGKGVITSLTIIDEDSQGVAMYVFFHSTSTSMGSENSAPNITDANLSTAIQGFVSIAATDWITITTGGTSAKLCCITGIGLPVKAVSGTDDLYVSVVNGAGAPDWDADSLVMKIGAILD